MPIELAKISSLQLKSLTKEKTVFFFPVGPLEDHGPHLPMGLDAEEAYRLCHLAACQVEKEIPGWTGVLMPQAPLGVDSNTTEIAFTVRPYVLRDWLVDTCSTLIRNGFFHFVCFSGHLGPRQLTAIEEAGILIRKSTRWNRMKNFIQSNVKTKPSLISASSGAVDLKDVMASPFWPDPLEHGGARDTAIALAVTPELVDPDYKSLPVTPREKIRWKRNFFRRSRRLSNYWGNPAAAGEISGEETTTNFVNRLFPKMRAVWEGTNPNSIFRSWYSVLPPNKSFFRGWLLVFLICFFIAAWGYLYSLTFQVN